MEISLENLRESIKRIVEKGIANAKFHGINLHPGVENLASGDCAFECMIDGISTRQCFAETFDGTPAFWRHKWCTEAEDLALKFYDAGMSEVEWRAAWDILKISGQYEFVLGDLILPVIAHCTQKDVLIFNTSPRAHAPIFVVESSTLGQRRANTEIPVVMAYDQSHFESLVPDTEEDVHKTIQLKKRFLEGQYHTGIVDIPFLKEQEQQEKCSYGTILKKNNGQLKTAKKKVRNTMNHFSSEIPGLASTEKRARPERNKPMMKGELKLPPQKKTRSPKDITKCGNRFSCLPNPDSPTCYESLEELENIKNKDRTEAQKFRFAELKKLKKNEKDKQRIAAKRDAHSAEEKRKLQSEDRERKAAKKDSQSADERRTLNSKECKRKAAKRDSQSYEEKQKAKQGDCKRKAKQRTSVCYKEALNNKEILEGSFAVPTLRNSNDTIGEMDVPCQYCGALKFAKETASTCCSNGKVNLDPFPLPPDEINKLWHAETTEGRLFRENSRAINNAVCLTSLQVKERNLGMGFTPCVTFQGKVTMRAGPLQAEEGERPCFSQLYVHDSNLETSQRFKNMTIPASMSKPQKKVLEGVLSKVQNVLHIHNPFVKDFKQILEIPAAELAHGKIVISAKSRPTGEHARRYNAQANLEEVSILTNNEPHDLVLQQQGGGLQKVSDLNPKGMPLHFTLLFPHGTYGWDPTSKHTDGKRRVTTREFYVYYINERDIGRDYIHLARRLFQEWICMAWVAVENQKLMFQRMNQKALRADTYKNIRDATAALQLELAPREDGMFRDDDKRPALGRKILSSSFSGSPRWYNAKFQDGMAICREYHKPDYFITMTCNPNWPEIKDQLKRGQTAQDRPDIVARVFKLKKDQMMQDLKSGHVLGKVVAHMHVVEFQKRGLPHAHILVILADDDRTMTADMVDSIVSAELPPDPNNTDDPYKAAELKRLEDIVLTNMVHGPCGAENPSCPCMDNGRCTKNFPKDFCKQTIVDQDNNYATYRRRAPGDGGRQVVCPKTKRIIDNRYVVPYSPFLCLRYNCHINVEFCTSPKAAKYLYKYVTKGSDRAMVATIIEGENEQTRDEISEYEDLRSVGSSEATWHLMTFPITDRYPPVHALRVHTEDQQQVVFDEGTEEESLEKQRETELTAFFKLNCKLGEEGLESHLMPTYIDLPKKFRYDKAKKEWISRKARSEDTVIGRVHTVNPVAGEVFYLRILLHNDHCRGKTSFTALRSLVNGRICESYKEVCRELGLLRDDLEWQRVLEESAATELCPQIRELFVVILIFCQPANPRGLYDEFWQTWIDDFEQRSRHQSISLDANQLETMLLLDLELRLQSFEKELVDFGLPKPTADDLVRVVTITNTDPVVIREEKDYNLPELIASVKTVVPMFTHEQFTIFETVLEAVNQQESLCVFINARGGCGKTFLLNAILSAVRSLDPNGCVALAMATTGIASNLLKLGRTFHSRLKAPLAVTEDSMLQISAQSGLAKLVRMSRLLLIDEATMLDGFQLEALDRSLRDITGHRDQHFGGKIILLAGDFRQCLPVVPHANRAGTISHCINMSYLWQHFKVLTLTQNMRVMASGDPVLEEFDNWTLSIGNGLVPNGVVPIPERMVTKINPNTKTEPKNEEKSMKKFCQEIFPNLKENINTPGWLEGRTILAPTNKEVDAINGVMQDWLPDDGIKLHSADSLENPQDSFRFNTEYLNTLRPNGFPQHLLCLKPGIPLMLLRNINPRQGLCNGTRLIFDKCIDNKLLQCRIVETGRVVLIPRITFIPKLNEYPFEWQRRQFPVRTAFAMTINKSQGQTLKFAGIWLRTQVFTHGQLYVACSRVSSPNNLRFALMCEPNKQQCSADNIVYQEVLLSQE